MKSVLLRRLRSSGAYGVESDAISDALATRAGIALKPWKYATTLFTDTAGTVAATQAGDIIAVAKCLDKGLQYQQTTLANRPILTRWPKSGKRNLLTWTEDFSNAVWLGSTTISSGISYGAISLQKLANPATGTVYSKYQTLTVATATTYTLTSYASFGDAPFVVLFATDGVANGLRKSFNIQTGTVGATQTIGSGWTMVSADMELVATGVYRIRMTVTNAASTRMDAGMHGAVDTDNTINSTINKFNYCGGVMFEAGSSATAYQKVTIAQNITEAGSADCWGLTFDGTNDGMATAATLDLSGSDKVGVFAGVTKLNTTAAFNCVFETGTGAAPNFSLFAPDSNNNNYQWRIKDSARPTQSAYPSPRTNMTTGLYDAAGVTSSDQVKGRINGAAIVLDASLPAAVAGGNFNNALAYIGARTANSVFFNGIIWGLAVVSTLTTADTTEIAAIEAQIADNCPTVTL